MPSSEEEAALLAAIAEAPDDDAPRLVYGDWLLAQPDVAAVERGELIQLQCAIARMPEASVVRSALVRRVAVLLARRAHDVHAAGGADDVVALGGEATIERGLVAGVVLPAHRLFAEVAPALAKVLERSPVTSLAASLGDSVAPLLMFPGLERIHSLDLSVSREASSFTQLWTWALPALRSLRIMCYAPRVDLPLEPLLDSPLAEQLIELGLDWLPPVTRSFPSMARALASSALGRRLQSLALDTHEADGDTLEVLASIGLPQLRSLSLAHATEARFGSLLEAIAFPRLDALRIEACPWMTEKTTAAILDARPRLKSFVFTGPPGVYDAAEVAAHASHLTTLGLRRCRIDDRRAAELASAASLSGLRSLDLSGNQISTLGARTLARSKHLSSLHTLALHFNQGISGGAFISASSLEGLSLLDLRGNNIRPTTSIARRLVSRFGAAVRL